MTQRTTTSAQKGLSLIEVLIYMFVLVLLAGAVIGTLLALDRASGSISSEQAVESAAETSLGQMERQARNATSIDSTQSTFNTSPGQLMLDDAGSGATSTVQFYISGQVVHEKLNGTDQGPLSDPSAQVTSLIFRKITTGESQAVKIEMTITSGTGQSYVSRSFYDTAVLRGSY